jgi:beta-glucanase (GH16 family)
MPRRRTAALVIAGPLIGASFIVGLTAVGGAMAAPAQGAIHSLATTTSTTSTPTVAPAGATAQVSGSESSQCAGTTPPVAAPTGQWSCTLDDEFNGTSLDLTKWAPILTSTSSYTTGPGGSYVCYENNANTISESGGYLNLSVLSNSKASSCKEMAGSFSTKYEGGMITSKGLFSQEYGYFEVRAAMPSLATPGLQETLWLYPSNETLYGPWPDSGEIDYAEFYSKYPNNDVPVDHFPGSNRDPNATDDNCVLPGVTTTGQFNTYALMWTPTTITTYFNGVQCMSDVYASYVARPDKAPAPFNQPFFMNFTAALGVNNGNQFSASKTPLPATTQIDWARVWQY